MHKMSYIKDRSSLTIVLFSKPNSKNTNLLVITPCSYFIYRHKIVVAYFVACSLKIVLKLINYLMYVTQYFIHEFHPNQVKRS